MRALVAALVAPLILLPPAVLAQPPSSPAGNAVVGDTFGVDLASPQDPAGSPASPSTIALAGVRWVRITADWAVLEPGPGRFAWAPLDAGIRRAVSAGEHVVLLLEHTPKWAALTPNTPPLVWSHQPPRRPEDWTRFVTAIVSRYRVKIAAWQVEPSLDLVDFRGTNQEYRAMLRTVRVVVRRDDPRALVVAAAPGGLDLPFIKTMLARAGADFDAIMLYPRGRAPAEVLEALGVIRSRILTDGHHALWLSVHPDWGAPVRLAAVALAGGVTREFWPRLDQTLATAMRFLGGARFVGPLDRGPGVAALVFMSGASPVVAAWSVAGTQSIALATTGAPALSGPAGQPVAAGESGHITVDAEPVFVSNPSPAVVEEAARAARQGPARIPPDAAHDFSKTDTVSAALGATDVEHGLYNQRLRALPSGAVVPVTVDGVEAVRTNPATDAVNVYFDVDDSFAYYDDGRNDFVVSVQVHRAGAPQLVGFNLLYDSMTGYRFTPWQWVDAGDGWATYTFRITDADFSNTWGWDFYINGAGDRKEDLVVRSVTVQKLPAGTR